MAAQQFYYAYAPKQWDGDGSPVFSVPSGNFGEHLAENAGSSGIFLETAHPAKFESTSEIIGNYDVTPESISGLFDRIPDRMEIEADYGELRWVLLRKI